MTPTADWVERGRPAMTGTFEYANPARISHGAGCLAQLPEAFERLGVRRPLLVSTEPVIQNQALISLFEACLPYPLVATAGIGGHAPLQDVEAALAKRADSGADVVVSLGGGGPIDAAKAVARGSLAAAARIGVGGDTQSVGAVLPHLAVPTTLAAAELSWRVGFSNAAGDKVGFADRSLLPHQVFYEPRLARFTPLQLWLATGIRAIDHAIEGFLAPGEHPLSDVLAVEAVVRLGEALRASAADPDDVEARGRAQVGAWFSYTLPLESMKGLSHQMGKQIGARHGIGHGDTSALLLPHVLRYRALRDPRRSDELRVALRCVDGGDLPPAERIAALVEDLALPRHLSAFGLTTADLRRAADEIGNDAYPADDLFGVYKAAL
jgi:alcohol dehydrogenase class IV